MKNVILTAIAIGATAFAANSQATVISGGSFNNPQSTTEISQTGNLQLFDTSLGTLNSVSFTFNGSFTTTIDLTNAATQSQTVKATSNIELPFTSANAGIATALATISPLILTAATGVTTLAAGASKSYGPLSDSQSANGAFTGANAAVFAKAGGGTFDVSCTSFTSITIAGGGGNVRGNQSTVAGCGATVSYDYTASVIPPATRVPEPATLTILGLGLAGIGFARKRKSA